LSWGWRENSIFWNTEPKISAGQTFLERTGLFQDSFFPNIKIIDEFDRPYDQRGVLSNGGGCLVLDIALDLWDEDGGAKLSEL
jgi:hypothetical protein